MKLPIPPCLDGGRVLVPPLIQLQMGDLATTFPPSRSYATLLQPALFLPVARFGHGFFVRHVCVPQILNRVSNHIDTVVTLFLHGFDYRS